MVTLSSSQVITRPLTQSIRHPQPDPEAKWGSRAKTRQVNITDPDSRTLKDGRRFIQGYNAQAAVTEDQIVVAAEMTNMARDSVVFKQVVSAIAHNLATAGGPTPETLVADAGYWDTDKATLDIDTQILIAPMPATAGITDPTDPRIAKREETVERLDRGELTIRDAANEMGVSTTWARKLLRDHQAGRFDPAQLRAEMLERLGTPEGAAAYAKRKITVDPVFGNLKANLRFRRFSRRGLTAVESEWRLICTIHNLLKLHRHRLAAPPIHPAPDKSPLTTTGRNTKPPPKAICATASSRLVFGAFVQAAGAIPSKRYRSDS